MEMVVSIRTWHANLWATALGQGSFARMMISTTRHQRRGWWRIWKCRQNHETSKHGHEDTKCCETENQLAKQ